GKQGGVLIEVNALGQKLKTLEKTDYIAGNNLQLTIDMDLEMSCQEMLQGKKGAIVVMNPQNGEILAMVSSPTYDSNMFTKGMRHDEWRQLDEKKKLPFLNRAIQGMYPPGSLFKVVTAVAALENRVTNENRTIYSTGEFHYGNQVFRDWKEDGHGVTNLKKAIACSVNTYFFQIGLEAGIKNIYTYAIDFGLGKKTGIELIGEKEGLIPNPDWMRVHNKKPWYPGDTINLSIGQGLVLVTPLQMANMYCSIANGGILFKPRLVKAITTTDGEVLHRFLPEVERNLTVSKKTLEVIKNCLREVIKTGTGKAAFAGFPVKVVGKTGSAQNPGGKPHAWFVGFAPYHEPSIVVAVLVEHGEHGAGIGAGIALKTFQLLCEKGLLASSMQKRASYA
ncbi:MAG: penicillin-binding transpeptidase domain-containing protein, partial [Thermodesulfobacteriota bacterium]|nr:penicillin-binding transpeptidase domain-containing protein [Thermodesulfobacteriota bacterium]